MNWHSEAEAWARDTAVQGSTVPVVMPGEAATHSAAPVVVLVQPATMTVSDITAGGSLSADMSIGYVVVAAGDSGAPVGLLPQQVDALVAALAANGGRDITTDAGYLSLPDMANSRPSRSITATITVTADCP